MLGDNKTLAGETQSNDGPLEAAAQNDGMTGRANLQKSRGPVQDGAGAGEQEESRKQKPIAMGDEVPPRPPEEVKDTPSIVVPEEKPKEVKPL